MGDVLRTIITAINDTKKPRSKMTFPDYNQRAEDHQSLLILVKQIGSQISNKAFNKIFEKISRAQYIKVQDSQGTGVQRVVWLRYKKFYPVENNEWGDFQAHRKVLGLISVGKCNNQSEVEELCKHHNAQREKYSSTLYDSRCLVFCSGSESPSGSGAGSEKVSPDDQSGHLLGDPKVLLQNQGPSSCRGSDENLFEPYEDLVPKVQDAADDRDSGVYEQISLSAETDPSIDDRGKEGTMQASDGLSSIFKEDATSSFVNNPAFTSKDSSPSDGEGIQSASPSSTVSTSSPLGSPTSPSVPSVSVTDSGAPNSPAGSRKLMIPPTVKSRSTHCILYNSVDDCDQLEQDVYEFACSLFWVLESKRLDRSFEKQDRIPLLMASFEKKTLVGLDTDTRSYKKRCLGRMRKHVGDLALLAGLPNEALSLYTMGIDTLKAINDWLWLASAYEGLCAASVILQYPNQLRNTALHRNSSCPITHAPSVTKTKTGSLSSHSRSLPNGIDPAEYKLIGKSILSPEEIIEKYREAINHYSKYVQAQVIEIECSLKAARVMTLQEKYLVASEFIQYVVFVNLQQSDEEYIQRFCALSQLYTEIGFHRKAAFFKRVAAMRCASPQNANPNWNQCYHLLLQTLEGNKLTLDPKEFQQDHPRGWPRIQVQILQELVKTAKRMNNQSLAVRHMTFLLQTMFQYLTPLERKEYCSQLEALTCKCEGAPVPLALDSGVIIPPVNLLNFPSVRSFKPQNLAPHLRPIKIEDKAKTPTLGPFIFTPLKFHKDRSTENNTKLSFKWVEGCVCAVALQVYNPLPFELNVAHMGLLADGIVFESFPASLALPAESGPYPAQLLGTPHSTGELQILGYTSHVLGVKSNCRLRDLPVVGKQFFTIEVVPALPQIEVATSLPKASTFSSLASTSNIVMSAAVTLYAGESRECTITITNTGKELVEKIDVGLQTKMDKSLEEEYFTWSKENLDMQLPIAPGSAASFTLYINALGDFVSGQNEMDAQRSLTSSPAHARGKASRPSSTNPTDAAQKRKPLTVTSPEPFPQKIVEAVLQLQYSGGPGIKEGYCRQCAVALTVEIQPSVVITKWDVLPAEVPNHCYLVLDVLNATSHEMELHYATNKQIFIEARETCRIPVPVERCTLQYNSLTKLQQDERSGAGAEPKKAATSLENVCREHLVNLVDLRWTLPGLDISGRASIADVTWTHSMLDVIVMSPIQWEIELNNKPYKVEEEFSFLVGELITLNVAIRNLSDAALQSLWLCVQGYQDYQNGHQNYSLAMHRTVAGCDKVMIDEILPQETFFHRCGFLFLHAGAYKLDIQCSSTKYQDVGKLMAGRAIAKSQSKDRAGREADQSRYVWKCAPSIEISVMDE